MLLLLQLPAKTETLNFHTIAPLSFLVTQLTAAFVISTTCQRWATYHYWPFSTSCQCYFKTESWGVVSSHFHMCVFVVCWVGPALVISFHKRAKLLLQSLLFGRAWIYVLHYSLTSDKCTIWSAVLAFHARVCFYHSYLTADKDLSYKPQADRQFPVVLK